LERVQAILNAKIAIRSRLASNDKQRQRVSRNHLRRASASRGCKHVRHPVDREELWSIEGNEEPRNVGENPWVVWP
jgi:hypothetical protein